MISIFTHVLRGTLSEFHAIAFLTNSPLPSDDKTSFIFTPRRDYATSIKMSISATRRKKYLVQFIIKPVKNVMYYVMLITICIICTNMSLLRLHGVCQVYVHITAPVFLM